MKRPFAVVTGASSGIGFELAKQFAQNGHDLLLASYDEAILDVIDELSEYGVDIECMEVNLATFNGVEILTDAIRAYKRPVDVLAITSGETSGGEFLKTNLREEINLINLNIISAMHLTKNLLGKMFDQGQGKILFTSSIDSGLTSPYRAVNVASNAFLTSFADSIRTEAKERGVTVTLLMPELQTISEAKIETDLTEMARQGYEAVMSGTEKVYSTSFKSRIQGWAHRILPEKFTASPQRH